MIDLLSERLLSLAEAARFLPGRPHPATLYRWTNPGLRAGTIRLETLRRGGRLYTSHEALRRFFESLGDRASAAVVVSRESSPDAHVPPSPREFCDERGL